MKFIWKKSRKEVQKEQKRKRRVNSSNSSQILALENLPTSSILQQSMNEMQNIHGHQSFYSDPSSKFRRFSTEKKIIDFETFV